MNEGENDIDETFDDIGDIIDEALDRDSPGINTREQ